METLTTPPNPFLADGAFVLPSFQQWFFFPGDWAIYLLASRMPAAAELLGVGAADYGGNAAAVAAWILWLLLLIALIAVMSVVRRFDRALTRGIVEAVAGVRRHLRMAIVFVRNRLRLRGQRLERRFYVTEPTLRLGRNVY